MEQPAAILNPAICTGLGNPELDLKIEVLHDRAGSDIVNVVLAWRLGRIGMNGAILDRPHIGLPIPTVECLTIPDFCVASVIVIRDRCRAAHSTTRTIPSPLAPLAALAPFCLRRTGLSHRQEGANDDEYLKQFPVPVMHVFLLSGERSFTHYSPNREAPPRNRPTLYSRES